MKNTKLLSSLFAVLAAVLTVGTVALSLLSLDAPARLVTVSDSAEQCTREFMDAFCRGDHAAAGGLMLGQLQLEPDQEPASQLAALLWEAYGSSLSYAFAGECYASDSGLCRDVTLTALDIPGVMALLKERSQDLLARQAAATAADLVFDDEGHYQEAFVMEVLCAEAAVILEEGGVTASRELTLELTRRDGQWWILPEQELLDAISGGMGS